MKIKFDIKNTQANCPTVGSIKYGEIYAYKYVDSTGLEYGDTFYYMKAKLETAVDIDIEYVIDMQTGEMYIINNMAGGEEKVKKVTLVHNAQITGSVDQDFKS